jgi:hypothetical protein
VLHDGLQQLFILESPPRREGDLVIRDFDEHPEAIILHDEDTYLCCDSD